MLVRVRPGAPIISSTYSGISRTAGAQSCRLAKVLANVGSARSRAGPMTKRNEMTDKLPAPCEHCGATGIFHGSECIECRGKGYWLMIDGRLKVRQHGDHLGIPADCAPSSSALPPCPTRLSLPPRELASGADDCRNRLRFALRRVDRGCPRRGFSPPANCRVGVLCVLWSGPAATQSARRYRSDCRPRAGDPLSPKPQAQRDG